LMFPPDEWEFKGGARHYVESIDEEGLGLMKIFKQCLENSCPTAHSWRSSRIAHATWNAVKG